MYSRSIVFILLFALWALVSGDNLSWNWWLGALACLTVTYFVSTMDLIGGTHPPLRAYLKLPFYLLWLLAQVIASNWDVARHILSPSLPISPRWLRVKLRGRSTLARTLYPNSITLTPGTASAEIRDDELEVHALTKNSAGGIEKERIARKIEWLER